MKKILLLCILSAAAILTSGAEYKLSNIKLTLASKKFQSAYDELKYHLELAAGKLAPGKDALEIIVGRAGDKAALRSGESRYLYKNGKLYIWGRDSSKGLIGTAFAVYGFLENKLGVRWIYAGKEGIHVPKQDTISFKEGENYSRVSQFYWGWLRKSDF